MSSSSTSSINTNTSNNINNAHQGGPAGSNSTSSYNSGYQGRSSYHYNSQKNSKNRYTASNKPPLNSNKYFSPASKDHGYSNYHQSNTNMKRGGGDNNYYQSTNTNTTNTSNEEHAFAKTAPERKTEGIHRNPRLTNATTIILGCPVLLKVKSNDTYHGIFVTYSPEFDVVLECCHKVDSSNEVVVCGRSIPKANQVKARFFERDDIVEMIAQDVDIDFALKSAESNFTDASIAQKVAKSNKEQASGGADGSGDLGGKELEPFAFDNEDEAHHNSTNSGGGLDDDPSNPLSHQLNYLELDSGVGGDSSNGGTGGWCAEDMLMVNQTKYGYKSTYNSDLVEYTLPVEKENTEEYKRREEEAEKMAQEIESNTTYRRNVDKELSDNEEEEEKFSAVVRPSQGASSAANNNNNNEMKNNNSYYNSAGGKYDKFNRRSLTKQQQQQQSQQPMVQRANSGAGGGPGAGANMGNVPQNQSMSNYHNKSQKYQQQPPPQKYSNMNQPGGAFNNSNNPQGLGPAGGNPRRSGGGQVAEGNKRFNQNSKYNANQAPPSQQMSTNSMSGKPGQQQSPVTLSTIVSGPISSSSNEQPYYPSTGGQTYSKVAQMHPKQSQPSQPSQPAPSKETPPGQTHPPNSTTPTGQNLNSSTQSTSSNNNASSVNTTPSASGNNPNTSANSSTPTSATQAEPALKNSAVAPSPQQNPNGNNYQNHIPLASSTATTSPTVAPVVQVAGDYTNPNFNAVPPNQIQPSPLGAQVPVPLPPHHAQQPPSQIVPIPVPQAHYIQPNPNAPAYQPLAMQQPVPAYPPYNQYAINPALVPPVHMAPAVPVHHIPVSMIPPATLPSAQNSANTSFNETSQPAAAAKSSKTEAAPATETANTSGSNWNQSSSTSEQPATTSTSTTATSTSTASSTGGSKGEIKSKLNPNAAEFKLNPNAAEFNPGASFGASATAASASFQPMHLAPQAQALTPVPVALDPQLQPVPGAYPQVFDYAQNAALQQQHASAIPLHYQQQQQPMFHPQYHQTVANIPGPHGQQQQTTSILINNPNLNGAPPFFFMNQPLTHQQIVAQPQQIALTQQTAGAAPGGVAHMVGGGNKVKKAVVSITEGNTSMAITNTNSQRLPPNHQQYQPPQGPNHGQQGAPGAFHQNPQMIAYASQHAPGAPQQFIYAANSNPALQIAGAPPQGSNPNMPLPAHLGPGHNNGQIQPAFIYPYALPGGAQAGGNAPNQQQAQQGPGHHQNQSHMRIVTPQPNNQYFNYAQQQQPPQGQQQSMSGQSGQLDQQPHQQQYFYQYGNPQLMHSPFQSHLNPQQYPHGVPQYIPAQQPPQQQQPSQQQAQQQQQQPHNPSAPHTPSPMPSSSSSSSSAVSSQQQQGQPGGQQHGPYSGNQSQHLQAANAYAPQFQHQPQYGQYAPPQYGQYAHSSSSTSLAHHGQFNNNNNNNQHAASHAPPAQPAPQPQQSQ